MPTVQRQPLRGRDIYTLTAQGAIANSLGVLSASGANQSYHAICDGVSYRGRNVPEQIASITSPYENNFIVERDDSVVLTEILRLGLDQQLAALTFFLAGTDFTYFVLQRGYPAGSTGVAVATIQFYGVMSGYREMWHKGKCTGELTINQIALIDQNNPLYSMAAV